MYRIGPINRKSNFHFREKCLIGMVLATLCLLCFGGIFLLPDNFGGERVLRVYKQFQKAGPEMFIPAPPLAGHGPKDSDPHFIGDRQKLQAKIKEELGEIMDKPLLQQRQADAGYDGEELGGADDGQQQQQGVAPPLNGEGPPDTVGPAGKARISNDDNAARMDNNNLPVGKVGNIQFSQNGNADPDPAVEEKRQKVKEVSTKMCT
ncbi:PREDICTED: mannosyl-oligosaccharide alpha-1,2-mannosidase IA-like [Rhagoletis zephyria]|uniref:mannosyl-oligosaccharide alpha-1,2-mannosidase IA-like n=1 Tax=Rhagoletis zephyria TaxID=28612 RepID=UPI00081164E8|nr:PREDICTED: mannosyl-oligosaccharide alpha-1,2-mannosidase IA-like [Rhagoletis zephyria]